MRVVITPYGVQQPASGNKASFGNTAFPDNHLPGIGRHLIGIVVKVAYYTVHLYRLVDVPGNDTVIIPLSDKSL